MSANTFRLGISTLGGCIGSEGTTVPFGVTTDAGGGTMLPGDAKAIVTVPIHVTNPASFSQKFP